MAITIKNEEQLALMRRAGQMLARVHKELARELHEGMTTKDVDRLVEELIMSFGGYPNFKGYNGFPAAACVSVNDEIVHGIPSDKRYLNNGDIVTIDTGVLYKGYHSDAARTHAIGEISYDAKKLIEVTEDAFFKAIKQVKPGNHIVDIGRVVQQIALSNGYSVVRTLTGHGIGEDLHEAPNIPNYRTLMKGARLRKGMTLAIEPMINMGNYDVRLLDNRWTYATADGSLSSHYENTVAVTDEGYEILTLTPEEIRERISEYEALSDASDKKKKKEPGETITIQKKKKESGDDITDQKKKKEDRENIKNKKKKNEPRGDIKEAIKAIPEDFKTAAMAREDPSAEGKPQGTKADPPAEGKPQGTKEDPPAEGKPQGTKADPPVEGKPQGTKADPSTEEKPQGVKKDPSEEKAQGAKEDLSAEKPQGAKKEYQTLTPEEKRIRREALFEDD